MQITDLQMVHKELNTSYIPQYIVVANAKHLNIVQKENVAKNVIRIISVLNAYYGTNAYCVRIKGVLKAYYRRREQPQMRPQIRRVE